jgi:hypothetical protein
MEGGPESESVALEKTRTWRGPRGKEQDNSK